MHVYNIINKKLYRFQLNIAPDFIDTLYFSNINI